MIKSKTGYEVAASVSTKNTQLLQTLTNLSLLGLITTSRVKSIVLDDTHPRFQELGGWNALGTIEVDSVENPSNSNIYPTAKPLYSNRKNYPLINEIVYILSLPDNNLDNFTNSQTTYYIDIVALWNHPHHNAYPVDPTNPPESQQKDYIQTQAGSVRRVTDQSTEINLGSTFVERTNIHPLLPLEGDVIEEGRWSNSIRLTSTVTDQTGSIINTWSDVGTNGDPLIIIRTSQPTGSSEQGWVPIMEDINNDKSSIWLTSTQQLPLNASNNNYGSYDTAPISPSQFSGEQIIINSGRLVLNAKTDHILFISPQSVGISSPNFNINATKTVVLSSKICLGDKSASHPIILGDDFLNDFNSLINNLNTLCTALQTLQSLPPGTPFISLVSPTVELQDSIETMQSNLQAYQSKISFINK